MKKLTLMSALWAGLAIVCLGAAIIAGAYWHLWTAGISALMAVASLDEKTEEGRA
jgi:hypothetical protein